ncbi:MAG: hypothetical protein ACKVRP_14890 [Bacteroidota bacterium]
MRRIATVLLVVVATAMCSSSAGAQSRYQNSLSFNIGAYAASGFGTNTYLGVRYNYFFLGGQYFVEGSLGFGSLRSRVLENVAKAQVFESERLYAYEFIGAYDPAPAGYFPYIALGVAGINQGGQSTFAGVVGLGKRIPLTGLFGTNQLGVRYDVRDQIFSQSINNSDPFISHNIVFTVGLQLYF